MHELSFKIFVVMDFKVFSQVLKIYVEHNLIRFKYITDKTLENCFRYLMKAKKYVWEKIKVDTIINLVKLVAIFV